MAAVIEKAAACNKCAFIISLFLILFFAELGNSTKGNCPPLSAPYLGKLVGKCSNATEGDICTLNCNDGYEIKDKIYRKICNASTGLWHPDKEFHCIDHHARCLTLHSPVGGYLKDHCSNLVGSTCSIGCHSGYELVGSEHITCINNQWVPPKPKCKQMTCPQLENPLNGVKVLDRCKSEMGESCEFSCNPEFYLIGSRVRYCSSTGIWSGHPVRCVPTCPKIIKVQDGKPWGQCSPGVAGYSCHVTCAKGYELDEPKDFVTCKSNGQWNAPIPKCKRVSCPPLDPPENGNLLQECRPGIYGFPCIFSCDYGYRLEGPQSVVCQANGNWSQATPSCEKVHCPAISLDNMRSFEGDCDPGLPKHWCNVTCMLGFRNSGHNDVLCSPNGEWLGAIPNCTKRTKCRALRPPKNGYLGECDRSIGGVCNQFCNADYIEEGSRFRTCKFGLWDGSKLRCIKRTKYMAREGITDP